MCVRHFLAWSPLFKTVQCLSDVANVLLCVHVGCTCRLGNLFFCVFTCTRSWQVELRPGVPWSAAVTVKLYSARSAHLKGEAVLSSPLFWLREKRSALGPSGNTADMIKNRYQCKSKHNEILYKHTNWMMRMWREVITM